MKRFWAVLLTLALVMGVNVPTAGAADHENDEEYQYWYENILPNILALYTYTDWVISDDFSQVTVGGKTYPLDSLLVRDIRGNYRFWNWWIDYLLNFKRQQEYTPDQWYEEQIIPRVREEIHEIAANFPSEEIILINGRPWQETEWAEEYLSLFPAEYHELAKDKTINGWLREAAVLGIPVEQLRTWPKAQIPVRLVRYRGYHTIDDFIADGADFENGSKSKEDIAVSAGLFLNEAPTSAEGSGLAEGDASSSSNSLLTKNRVRMVMRLNDPHVEVTNFVGTPYEYTGSMTLDQPPIAPNGHTLIPVRAFADTFGIWVQWNGETNTARLYSGWIDIYLTAGFKTVNVINHLESGNVEQSVPIAEPVRIVNGRTLIPLRFVAETFGFDVKWDGESQRITIEGDLDLIS